MALRGSRFPQRVRSTANRPCSRRRKSEGLIQAYAEGFGIRGYIFRFVSILGERYSHGHVYDFYYQLREHPGHLHILGDERQRKSYLYVGDCISAVLTALETAPERPVHIFNLGTDDYCEVADSASWICSKLGLSPEFTFGGGKRGWIGDRPFIFFGYEADTGARADAEVDDQTKCGKDRRISGRQSRLIRASMVQIPPASVH